MKDFLLNLKEKWDNLHISYKIFIVLITISVLSRLYIVFGG